MRNILINWLSSQHLKAGYKQETLFCTINLMDHYLDATNTAYIQLNKIKLQLLVLTC